MLRCAKVAEPKENPQHLRLQPKDNPGLSLPEIRTRAASTEAIKLAVKSSYYFVLYRITGLKLIVYFVGDKSDFKIFFITRTR